MLKIITVPNPILREKSKTAVIDKKTLDLIFEMKQTLAHTEGVKGVGLAAVQVGVPKSIFLAYSEASKKVLTFINPQIIWYSKIETEGDKKSKNKFEGCLSIPMVWAIVKRPKAVKISYQSESGSWQIRKFGGMTAKIIQHEFDHTQGILFTDRALKQGNKLYTIKEDQDGKEYFEEIKL